MKPEQSVNLHVNLNAAQIGEHMAQIGVLNVAVCVVLNSEQEKVSLLLLEICFLKYNNLQN